MRRFAKEWDKMPRLDRWMAALGMVVMALGMMISMYMLWVDRSLWCDEALLVENIMTRSLSTLGASPLVNTQAAPIAYLYVVKLLTMAFGTSPVVLRVWSVLSYFAVVLLTAAAARRLFHIRFYFLAGALAANLNMMLVYSNQFKQYMNECAFALLALFAYDWYRQNRSLRRMAALTAFFSSSILFSNPAAFLTGGILLTEIASAWCQRSRAALRASLMSAVWIAAFFLAYWMLWLSGGNSRGMQIFWEQMAIVLPTGASSFWHDIHLLHDVLGEFSSVGVNTKRFFSFAPAVVPFLYIRELFIIIFTLLSARYAICEENKSAMAVWTAGALALFASSHHMFPMTARLWTFCYPLLVLLSFYALDRLAAEMPRWRQIPSALSRGFFLALLFTVMALSQTGIVRNSQEEKVYWQGQESKELIAYLQDNIRAGEQVFVYQGAKKPLQYIIGYDTEIIGNGTEENILWAAERVDYYGSSDDEANATEDFRKIQQLDGCYVLTSHIVARRWEPLKTKLETGGTLREVKVSHGTVLYWWENGKSAI